MYFFIVNPCSSGGRGERIWKKLKKLLEKRTVSYEAYLTRQPGEARDYARALTENVQEKRIIVAVGGDGTFNEVLDGLYFYPEVSLGYIPAGSGNDFARSLRLPTNPKRALNKILLSPYYQFLDYGVLTYGDKAEHRRFAVSAGMGLDGEVCLCIKQGLVQKLMRRLRLGRFSYILFGLVRLIMAKPSRGYIILDRVKKIEFNHIYFISAHIHPCEGGGFCFAPGADAGDGKLSVCVVSHANKRKLLNTLIAALLRRKKNIRGIRRYECQEAAFYMEQPQAVHTDGEVCGTWRMIETECIRKKIRMIL